MKIVNCKVCNSEFEATHPANKICSDACRNTKNAKARREWRTKNPEVWKGYTNSYRGKNPIKAKLSSLRARCRKENIPFDLDEEFCIIPEFCPILGIPLDGSTRDNQWSFDRLIPEKGYLKDNVKIISMRANRLKNDASILDVMRILEYMKENA